jgi:DNA-binding CsgD family transcriptional regulator
VELTGRLRAAGLIGRANECSCLDALRKDAVGGRSGVLVISGEPGIGKTALLEHVIASASAFQVDRATGVESEMELPFAGLHQLCAPVLDCLSLVPEPQRQALSTAFGLSIGPAPDRFLVGLATLSLLTEVSERAPLLCVVDDAQWLDRASLHALAFVARRLLADRVCLLFATREVPQDLAGLPQLAVRGLGSADSSALLASVGNVRFDETMRERIIAETHGNPLALLEWPRWLTSADAASGFSLASVLPIAGQLEERFRRRLVELPLQSRLFVTLAAAEPTGDASLLWRAAEGFGVACDDAAPAIEAGLLDVGTRVLFRHPSVRSAAYAAASPAERQAAHRALAGATDSRADPDRRAWHLALATPDPDDEVAAELERSADRARARGGLSASAAMLQRSAALTRDAAQRVQRLIAAAHAHDDAGAPDAAAALLTLAETGPLDELSRARVELIRGGSASMWGDVGEAAELLLSAARRLEHIDAGAARDTYVAALAAAVTASNLAAPAASVAETAKAARAAPRPQGPERPQDLLLDGLALVMTDGTAAAAPTLRRALQSLRHENIADGDWWNAYLCPAATVLWDHESFRAFATSFVQDVRDLGALRMLPLALDTAALPHIFAGDLSTAESLIREAESVVEATASAFPLYAAAALAAWRGHESDAERLIGDSITRARARGQGMAVKVMQSALATLYNGLGRYDMAQTAAQHAAQPPSWWAFQLTLHELVEAAFRSGQPGIAANALEQLAATTGPIDSAWAVGVEARSRALLSTGDAAEALYVEAIEQLDRSPLRPEAARARLVYGEWLRRERRRIDARQQLRAAHDQLSAIGLDAFAERARRELRATGETVRKRSVALRGELTAQEEEVAKLARDGLTNREIGARLFISAHTAQYHLSKVFTKLGIRSRAQLDRALP